MTTIMLQQQEEILCWQGSTDGEVVADGEVSKDGEMVVDIGEVVSQILPFETSYILD